jgi:hypothetical protein
MKINQNNTSILKLVSRGKKCAKFQVVCEIMSKIRQNPQTI